MKNRLMKNRVFKTLVKIGFIVTGCLMLASFSPSLDGRAIVVEEGVFPQGLFAKTVGYLPGDVISVTNITGDSTVNLLVIGALDPSEGVAIMLSPEAAAEIGIGKNSNSIVKITKRSNQDDRSFGAAVIAPQYSDKIFDEPAKETVVENKSDEEQVPGIIEESQQVLEEQTSDTDDYMDESDFESIESEEPELDESSFENLYEYEEFEDGTFEEDYESEFDEEEFDDYYPELEQDNSEYFEDDYEDLTFEYIEDDEVPMETEPDYEQELETYSPAIYEEFDDEDLDDIEETVEPEAFEDDEYFFEQNYEQAAADEESLEEPELESEFFEDDTVFEDDDFEEEFYEDEFEQEDFFDEEEIEFEDVEEDSLDELADADQEEDFEEEIFEETEDFDDESDEFDYEEEFDLEEESDDFEDEYEEELDEELEPEDDFVDDDEKYEEIDLPPVTFNTVEPIEEQEIFDEEVAEEDDLYDDDFDIPFDDMIFENVNENDFEEVEFLEDEEEEGEEEYDAIVLVPAEDNPPVPVEEDDDEEDITIELPGYANTVEQIQEQKPAATLNEYSKFMIESASELEAGKYYIQIATLKDDANILEVLNKYANKYPITIIPVANGSKQILVGPLSMDEYGTVIERFKSYGYKDAFIRRGTNQNPRKVISNYVDAK